jgi:hypothetical protein
MAYTTINKSKDYHGTMTWSGNNSTQTITFAAYNGSAQFQPDWTWIKQRNGTADHRIVDAVRGATKDIYSNLSAVEGTNTNGLTAFNSDGFVLGSDGGYNGSGGTYVGWNWKAGGAGSANTDGSINSTVSVNTTAGFSIVSYTGTGANATVGHGLGAVPKMIIVKSRSGASDWLVYHNSLGNGKALKLNTTVADPNITSSVYWNNTSPTSSVFSLGTSGAGNTSSATQIAYCFAEKTGYSKFGSYTGNGSGDGTFVYTGFKPAFVIYKGATGANATDNWEMADNKRSPYNGIENVFYPNRNNAEGTGVTTRMDFLSNGFKMRTTGSDYNGSGQTYIYMAFGQSIVGSNNIPATAR